MTSVNVTRFFSCFPAQSSLYPTVISYIISTRVRRGKGKKNPLVDFLRHFPAFVCPAVPPALLAHPLRRLTEFSVLFSSGKPRPFVCESRLFFLHCSQYDDNPLTRCHFNGVQRPRREFLTFTFQRPLCAGDVPARTLRGTFKTIHNLYVETMVY